MREARGIEGGGMSSRVDGGEGGGKMEAQVVLKRSTRRRDGIMDSLAALLSSPREFPRLCFASSLELNYTRRVRGSTSSSLLRISKSSSSSLQHLPSDFYFNASALSAFSSSLLFSATSDQTCRTTLSLAPPDFERRLLFQQSLSFSLPASRRSFSLHSS